MAAKTTFETPEVIDLLPTNPSLTSFLQRVKELGLSINLENKIGILHRSSQPERRVHGHQLILTVPEEHELATEVLLLRHQFTECVAANSLFRQAALTIIQNIYLFKNRKIFFNSEEGSLEQERQKALSLLGNINVDSIPLCLTFQHLVIARIWHRILHKLPEQETELKPFQELHNIVERLNTLRNIYIIATTGLVRKLAAHIGDIYRQSVTYEDAIQIGSIGIARAAYRYHPSTGVRFSTFASKWVYSEIQRQALKGRLIKVSASNVELLSKSLREGDSDKIQKYSDLIRTRTPEHSEQIPYSPLLNKTESDNRSPSQAIEYREMCSLILHTVSKVLSDKSGDIIRRRFGLPPYGGEPQSVISISKTYGVTRSSIYQQENSALKKLRNHLSDYC